MMIAALSLTKYYLSINQVLALQIVLLTTITKTIVIIVSFPTVILLSLNSFLDVGESSQISAFSRVIPSTKAQRSTLIDDDLEDANQFFKKHNKNSQDDFLSNIMT